MKILVLQDGSLLADELARILRRQGCAVDVAHSGVEAMRAAAAESYDLIVLDAARGKTEERLQALMHGPRPAEETHRLVHGPLVVDLDAHRAYLAGAPLTLLPREWAVLQVLLTHAERVVSKETISRAVSNGGKPMSANTIETYISRLRAKLEREGLHIRTVHRVGYMLEAETAPATT